MVTALIVARKTIPSPKQFEESDTESGQSEKENGKLSKVFWLYGLFVFFSVAGFANFQLISYHFKVKAVVPDLQIPIFFAIAMGVDAVVALIIGKTYDKIGLVALITIPVFSIPIPFLAFSQSYALAIVSVVFWGVVMGVHETIIRAAIADLTSISRRGFAYGIFNAIYGGSWFVGSALMGMFYDISLVYLFVFVVVMELISLPIFFMVKKAALTAEKR
jgi:MFS family permease